MSRQLVDVAPAVANSQSAVPSDEMEDATELRDPVNAPEILVMILSPLLKKQLSRALRVSKQFNQSVLDSPEFRRKLFLEPKKEREFLKMMQGADQRCCKEQNDWQPVIVRETSQRCPCETVEPHTLLLKGYRTRARNDVDLRNFDMVSTVPASAFLTQPPLNEITIKHRGHTTRVRAVGGVTFGAIVKATKDIRKVVEDNLARSPRFAAYQYGRLDALALSISIGGAVFNNAPSVIVARKALVKAKELAVIDELEGKLLEWSLETH